MNFIWRLVILIAVIAYYVGVRTLFYVYVLGSPTEGPGIFLSWWFAFPISVVIAFIITAIVMFLAGEWF